MGYSSYLEDIIERFERDTTGISVTPTQHPNAQQDVYRRLVEMQEQCSAHIEQLRQLKDDFDAESLNIVAARDLAESQVKQLLARSIQQEELVKELRHELATLRRDLAKAATDSERRLARLKARYDREKRLRQQENHKHESERRRLLQRLTAMYNAEDKRKERTKRRQSA